MRREAWNRKKERKLACAVALSLACASFFALCPHSASAADAGADALPTRGRVAAGEATIGDVQKDADGKSALTIDQTSRRAIIDWATFDVGKDATVAFRTWTKDASGTSIPDPTAMTLNRVAASGGLSTIAGRITSTGVFLLQNPNGVLFAEGSSVDAAGIVVSTAAIDATQFMNERPLAFAQDGAAPDGAITVNGALTAHTDVAQAKAVLDQAVVNVGLPVGTALSMEDNVIRLVADGGIHVGRAGRLQATSSVTYTDALGDTATRDGTVFLRADADADEVQGDVALENTSASQVSAQHVIVQFEPEMTDGTKDYVKGAAEANALQEKFAATKDSEVAMLVNDIHELQAIEGNLTGSFVLGTDVAAAETSGWNDGKGFAPIGSGAAPFQGMLDGNGYRIYDLTIRRGGEENVGLFGVTEGARIAHTTLVDPIICGKNRVGGLVGLAQDKTVLSGDAVRKRDGSAREGATRTGALDNVFSDSSSLIDGRSIGGLVGTLDGSTICGFSQNAAAVKGGSAVGGLAGRAVSATITDSSNTGYTSAQTNLANGQKAGVITATSGTVGGLIGYAENTTVKASGARAETYNAGRVQGRIQNGVVSGGRDAGGLVGKLVGGSIRQAYNTNVPADASGGAAGGNSLYGSVEGTANVGGLVGTAEGDAKISVAFNTGNAKGTENVGGLVGKGASVTITQAYSGELQAVSVTGETNVGGLVGTLDRGTIAQSYSLSRVTGDKETTGLLVGRRTKNGTLGTSPDGKVYFADPADAAGRALANGNAEVLDGIGKDEKTLRGSQWGGLALEDFTHASKLGWGGLSDDAPQNDVWAVKTGVTPPLLRALLPRTQGVPKAIWTDVSMDVIPAEAGSKQDGAHGGDALRAFGDRSYIFAIRDWHRAPMEDTGGLFGMEGRPLPRFEDRASFFTPEGTVVRPAGLPLFGGMHLEVSGTQPLASGTTIATAFPELVVGAAEDSGEKAGNTASHSE